MPRSIRSDTVVVFLSLWFSTLPVRGQDEPPEEFRVQVGKNVYDIKLGIPVFVETPAGERVEVTLRRNEVLRFSGHGLSFNHPYTMKVNPEVDEGFVTINVESNESPLAIIQIYSLELTPEEASKNLVDGLPEELASRQGKLVEGSRQPVSRSFHGQNVTGEAMDFQLPEQKLHVEVYAFKKGDNVITVMFQHEMDDADLAQKSFQTIAESLE